MEMFRELGFPYDTLFDDLDFWLPRVRVEAEYHAPALMSDWLRMRTHIEKVGGSSVRWRTVLFNERTGEASAEMTFTVACMNRDTKKSCHLPEKLREALLSHRVILSAESEANGAEGPPITRGGPSTSLGMTARFRALPWLVRGLAGP